MTLIDWLMKKLGQDYEKRIAHLQETIKTVSTRNAALTAQVISYRTIVHELELELIQARRIDPATVRILGLDVQTISELKRGYIYQTGDCQPDRLKVRRFFEYLEFKRKEYCERFADRPNPRSPHGPWDVVFPLRGVASHRESRHADEPLPLPQAPGGVVLPNQDSSMLRGDQPAEGQTLSPGDPAQPEDER